MPVKRPFELSFNAPGSGSGDSLYERRRVKATKTDDSDSIDFLQDLLTADFGDIAHLPSYDVLTDVEMDGAATASSASTRASNQTGTGTAITTPLTDSEDENPDSLPTDSPRETAILLHNWRSAPVLTQSKSVRTKALIVHVRRTSIMTLTKRSSEECNAISAFVAATMTNALPWARDFALRQLEVLLRFIADSTSKTPVSPIAAVVIVNCSLKAAINLRNEALTNTLTSHFITTLIQNWHVDSPLFAPDSNLSSLTPFLLSYNFYTAYIPPALTPSTSHPHQLPTPLLRILTSWRAFVTAGSIPRPIMDIVTHLACLRSLASTVATRRLEHDEARELLALHATICHRLDVGLEVETKPELRCVLAAMRVVHHLILVPRADVMLAIRLVDLGFEVASAEGSMWSTDMTLVLWICAVGGATGLLLARDQALCRELRHVDGFTCVREDGGRWGAGVAGADDGTEGDVFRDDQALFRRVYARAAAKVGIRHGGWVMDVLERIMVPRALAGSVRAWLGVEGA